MGNNQMYLRAELSVLLVNDFNYGDSLLSFQKELKKRFKTNYELDQIEEELVVLKLENDVMVEQESLVTYPEQHYEGF